MNVKIGKDRKLFLRLYGIENGTYNAKASLTLPLSKTQAEETLGHLNSFLSVACSENWKRYHMFEATRPDRQIVDTLQTIINEIEDEKTERTQSERIDRLQTVSRESADRSVVPPDLPARAKHVAARLERRFGLGSDIPTRRRFYKRLENSVDRYGDKALTIISDCVCEAAGKRKPSNYFCKAARLRLAENECLASEGSTDW